MDKLELKELLDDLEARFNVSEFIADDPISVPHLFCDRNDIEISGFLAATIAWGNRKIIVRNAHKMVSYMDGEPYRFIMDASNNELIKLGDFVHRTFNGSDFIYFIEALRYIYKEHGGIGTLFENEYLKRGDIRDSIAKFHTLFFSLDHPKRVEKHLSSIAKGAACKRLNMFIKWMVRSDENGVDFGLWDKIPTSAIYLPLDVHTANVGRRLGLLKRKQNDWKSVEEITANLRELDPHDPIRYDFALFGAGISGIFKDNNE